MYILKEHNPDKILEARHVINMILRKVKYVRVNGVTFENVKNIDIMELDGEYLVSVNTPKYSATVDLNLQSQRLEVSTTYAEINVMHINIDENFLWNDKKRSV